MAFHAFKLVACVVFSVVACVATAGDIQLVPLGTYKSGVYDAGGAEIPAYDPATKRLFVVNAGSVNKIDVLDLTNPALPTLVGQINPQLSYAGCSPNSIAIKKGVVAIACQDATATNNGKVLFYLASDTPATAVLKGSVDVGALPDMLTFTPDGNKLLVANEGEPNSTGTIDPAGSISIIDVSGLPTTFPTTSSTATFTAFNSPVVLDSSVRIVGTNANTNNVPTVGSVAQDLEPEYITVSPDSKTAYVTIQEANAIAIVDIATSTVTALKGLGFKDHNLTGNELDAGDQDGAGNTASLKLQSVPVKGMYQPDTIASFSVGDVTYLITANEGDVRATNGDFEAVRVGSGSVILDPTKFPNAAALKTNAQLGRLNVSRVTGDTDKDGDLDELYAFGARSFTIWSTSIGQIYDSGSEIERITAQNFPANFNASNTNNTLDNRSDDKGPEPEGLAVGTINGKTYAFIGLERIGGVMVYDVSNPSKPVFQQYINPRNFNITPGAGTVNTVGDLGPEGLIFIKGNESPNGRPLLVVCNEISGTTTIYSINTDLPTGPSTTSTPYLIPAADGVKTKSIFTTGDSVNLKPDGVTPYVFGGIPDGMGAFDNGDGTMTVLINHEIGNTSGVVRAHGSIGAYVSKLTIDKETLKVLKGEDLIQTVRLTNGTSAFSRFCSADLPAVSAYFNATTGLGTRNRIFMNGEESADGRAFAHVVTGAEAGVTYELPKLGKLGFENVVASPFAQDSTVVISLDDSSNGQLYVYIGTKTATGNEAQKAGLTNGALFGVKVTGAPVESRTTAVGKPKGEAAAFTLAALPDASDFSANDLEYFSTLLDVTRFARPEDGAWDPRNPNDFYFVTTDDFASAKNGTGSLAARSRLWRLRFSNISNPSAGGTITMLVDGTEAHQMFDNMTVDNNGNILLQEDPGGNKHNAKMWLYRIDSGTLTLIAKHDPERFGDFENGLETAPTAPFTNNEEASGIIDVGDLLGKGWYLSVVQAHYPSGVTETVEGGQLVALFLPEQFSRPKVEEQVPQVVATLPGVEIKPVLTVGQSVNKKADQPDKDYRFVGIPDGMGAYDNGDGTFTLLMNHELAPTVGITRAHGSTGAFVSRWKIEKSSLRVISIQDFNQSGNDIFTWNGTTYVSGLTQYQRLCSADLPSVSATFNPGSGLGTPERIFFNGEEFDTGGRAFAHIATGTNAGKSYQLPKLGKMGWENVLLSPFPQDKTLAMCMDDGPIDKCQLYIYVGQKAFTGNEIERSGLTNGTLYGFKVGSVLTETQANGLGAAKGAPLAFTLVAMDDQANKSGVDLETESNTKLLTKFFRPEDGQWDPNNPNDFYFVTTDRIDTIKDGIGSDLGRTRLWRVRFTDVKNPTGGGTITMLLDGTEATNMLDNMTIDNHGRILMQEDPGNQVHLAKIWMYDIATGQLQEVASANPNLFGDIGRAPTAPFSIDEETSGIISMEEILGQGWYFLVVQAHRPTVVDKELAELGQLVAMRIPTGASPSTTETGVSSSQTPYITPVAQGVKATAIMTVGDNAPNLKPSGFPFRMVGIPDGLGAYDNGDGTFTVLMNQEIGSTLGVTRAHGAKGAFVSKFTIDKATLQVKKLEDLIQTLVTTSGGSAINRLCSADLPPVSAFFFSTNGNGTASRIFLSGEEDDAGGRLFAHFATGPNAGTSFELPALGKIAWENALANPFPQNKTIVMGMDDASNSFSTTPTNYPSELYVYIGNKTSTGTELDKAGLTGGILNAIKTAFADEDAFVTANPTKGTAVPFTLESFGDVSADSGLTLQTDAIAQGAMQFHRVEDGAWDTRDPSVFYFVTTNSFSAPSRLWRVKFSNVKMPEIGGTLTMVLDGTEGQKMFDNLCFDRYGRILLQEDPGGNAHNSKIWSYDTNRATLTLVAKHDVARFGDDPTPAPTTPFTNNEESSGIIDVSDILGEGMYLLDVQAHYTLGGELVEGGQLLALHVPPTSNPQGPGSDQGVTSSQTPYLVPAASGVQTISILSAGDAVGKKPDGSNYRFAGIPDGLGAFDNGDGTFTVVINQEIGSALGITRAHGGKGAFVTKLTVDKTTLKVLKAEDLIQNLNFTSGTIDINRLCSADLAAPSAYLFGNTGTASRIFLSGEEDDNGGRLFASFITGPNAGKSFELPALGKIAWENALASPFPQAKTVVMCMDDAANTFNQATGVDFPSELYVYIGTKSGAGNTTEVQKAGLSGGNLSGLKTSFLDEDAFVGSTAKGVAVPFTLFDFGDVSGDTGRVLQDDAITNDVMQFHRVEDGAWDPRKPNDFYFVTTNSFSAPSRLWLVRFADITNPAAGGTLTMVLDGTEGQKMFDNVGMDGSGNLLLQEDPGGNAHNAKVWQYNVDTGSLTVVAKHDVARFGDIGIAATTPFTNNEEASGVIDVSDILGRGWFLSTVQAHYTFGDAEIVEGGQLVALYVPNTGTPQIELTADSQIVAEGTATSVSFGVKLDGPIANPIVIPFTVSGTAVGGGVDHSLASGNITIAAGSVGKSTTFTLVDDTVVENTESIVITLGVTTNGNIAGNKIHTVFITDNDGVSIGNDTVAGNEDTVLTTTNVFANDGAGATFVGFSQGANGTVVNNGNGIFTYTPAANFFGTDSFSYTVTSQPKAGSVERRLLAKVSNNGRSGELSTAVEVPVLQGGYGSAIAPVPGVPNEYYLLTDRGPNINGPSSIPNSKIFPVPNYAPRIGRFQLTSNGNYRYLYDVVLKREDGVTRLTGLPNPANAGGTGEVALSADGTQLGTDPEGFDSEGLVALANGQFWISDEYGPWIANFDSSGSTLERVGPFAVNSKGHKLPAVFAKRQPNRGMEGLCITPDGTTLVGAMQSTLVNGNTNTSKTGTLRILFYNIATGATKQYLYLQEDLSNGNKPTGISEICAISNTEFLVLERDGSYLVGDSTLQVKKIFKISIAGATDVSDPADSASGKLFNGLTIEKLSENLSKTAADTALRNAGIVPVSKSLFYDLAPLGALYNHDKVEGIALVGNNLVVSNDDDFAVGDSSGKLIVKLTPQGVTDGCEILVIPQATATVNVTVNPVNDIPSFTKGADQTVAENSGAATVAAWATGVSAGPANESAQVLTFTLTNDNNSLFSAQPAVAANGTLTFTPATNAFGVANVTVTLKDNGGTANGGVDTAATQTFKITVTKVNEAPVIASMLANPNPANVGQSVAFSAVVTDGDSDPLTYAWNWGDNTTGTGATPTKTYTAVGTYTVTLTVDDGQGGTATKTLTVNVMGAGFEMDTDGDGLSDAVEIAAGSKPNDATSVPNGITANPTAVDLAVSRLSIKFNFAKGGADQIMLLGNLPVADGFNLSGQQVVVSIAGVAKSFTLNEKGASPRANDTFKFSKPNSGTAKFSLKFSKGTFANTLASAGLTNETFASKDNKRVDVLVTVLFNGKLYKDTVTQTYIAKKDGKASTK